MDWGLLFNYSWVVLILVGLEGLLSADNALVLAVMVRELDSKKRKRALLYGLLGAFILRFAALFVISYLANVWEVQLLGGIYLLYVGIHSYFKKGSHPVPLPGEEHKEVSSTKRQFWTTVVKVELADLAFAVDSILAAVALAKSLPHWGEGHIGGLNTGIFIVIFTGGFLGLIMMRFAASIFTNLLEKRPTLEKAAFVIVAWVGVKLLLMAFEHHGFHTLTDGTFFSFLAVPEGLLQTVGWNVVFYGVMVSIALWGWFRKAK